MKLTNVLKMITTGICLVLTMSAAIGDQVRPTDIYLPEIIVAGTAQPCVVTVEGSGTAHIHSIPPGVVDSNLSVQSGNNYINIPFSQNYSGVVTIYATMDGSSQVVGTITVVLPNP